MGRRKQRPPCPVQSTEALDVEWIPVVASHGWLIITRDGNLQAHRNEIASPPFASTARGW